MAFGDASNSADQMDWETNPTPATKALTTQTGNFADITELTCISGEMDNPVVNHSKKYPLLLPAAVACLKDARSGNQEGPATTPPTYILDPPHFLLS